MDTPIDHVFELERHVFAVSGFFHKVLTESIRRETLQDSLQCNTGDMQILRPCFTLMIRGKTNARSEQAKRTTGSTTLPILLLIFSLFPARTHPCPKMVRGKGIFADMSMQGLFNNSQFGADAVRPHSAVGGRQQCRALFTTNQQLSFNDSPNHAVEPHDVPSHNMNIARPVVD